MAQGEGAKARWGEIEVNYCKVLILDVKWYNIT